MAPWHLPDPWILYGCHSHRSINSSAPLVETVRSRIDLEAILDLHAYDGLARQPDKFGEEEHCIEATGVTTVTLRHTAEEVALSAVETFLQVVD